MALAEDLNEQAIHVGSDCKVVVEDIRDKTAPSYDAILHEILDRKSAFYSCNISFESRSSNFEAHNLAKHALTLGHGQHVWLGHPGELDFVSMFIRMF